MTTTQIVSIISIIGAMITAIATSIACLINYKSTILLKEQMSTGCINQCNERYCNIVSKINESIYLKNENNFKIYCYQLFELLAHQFILWRNKLLPDSIFLEWSHYNSRQLELYNFDNGIVKINIFDLWVQALSNNKFYYDSNFVTYMKYIFDKDVSFIKDLKIKNSHDYRI